jgi:hypothetical protein
VTSSTETTHTYRCTVETVIVATQMLEACLIIHLLLERNNDWPIQYGWSRCSYAGVLKLLWSISVEDVRAMRRIIDETGKNRRNPHPQTREFCTNPRVNLRCCIEAAITVSEKTEAKAISHIPSRVTLLCDWPLPS